MTDWRRHEESAGPSTRMPLLFVAGWASTDRTWDLVLPRLVDHFDLYYLASREKPSCRLDAGASLSPVAHARDLVDVVRYLGLDQRPYGVVGASTGSNSILDA
ncbi:alpha/beta fold hydrolase, partial [Nocardioides pyridinolyticus]